MRLLCMISLLSQVGSLGGNEGRSILKCVYCISYPGPELRRLPEGRIMAVSGFWVGGFSGLGALGFRGWGFRGLGSWVLGFWVHGVGFRLRAWMVLVAYLICLRRCWRRSQRIKGWTAGCLQSSRSQGSGGA